MTCFVQNPWTHALKFIDVPIIEEIWSKPWANSTALVIYGAMTNYLNSDLYHGEVSFESKPRVTLGCSVGRVFLEVDGWMNGWCHFPSFQTLYQIQISWHVLIWFWVLTPQTTPSFQSGLKAWSRQSQAMSVIHLVESVGCKPLVGHSPVSFLSRTWHVLNGVDAEMLALPTVAGEGLIHSINGIIPGLDPLGDPKECESSTDWHSQYVPQKNGTLATMIQKEFIVCQTCFRDAAFSLGLLLWSFIF